MFLTFSQFLLIVGTPFWKLVLKQFDDLLVKILIAAAVVSFFLALANGETGLSAFLEPSVRYQLISFLSVYTSLFTLSFRPNLVLTNILLPLEHFV